MRTLRQDPSGAAREPHCLGRPTSQDRQSDRGSERARRRRRLGSHPGAGRGQLGLRGQATACVCEPSGLRSSVSSWGLWVRGAAEMGAQLTATNAILLLSSQVGQDSGHRARGQGGHAGSSSRPGEGRLRGPGQDTRQRKMKEIQNNCRDGHAGRPPSPSTGPRAPVAA